MNATDKGVKRALSKFGAFVRTRAKSSIRKRKKISQPGQPPSSHTGKLKKLIFFGYDREKKSVVVGPLLFGTTNAPESFNRNSQTSDWSSRRVATGVPERLEKGVGIMARPFMTPAFETEKKNLDNCFKDCIK